MPAVHQHGLSRDQPHWASGAIRYNEENKERPVKQRHAPCRPYRHFERAATMKARPPGGREERKRTAMSAGVAARQTPPPAVSHSRRASLREIRAYLSPSAHNKSRVAATIPVQRPNRLSSSRPQAAGFSTVLPTPTVFARASLRPRYGAHARIIRRQTARERRPGVSATMPIGLPSRAQ